MRDLKYIIVLIGGYEVAIVFNGLLTHASLAPIEAKIVSAGFCSLNYGRFTEVVVTIHESESAASLPNYPPRAEDKIAIQQTLNKSMF